MSRQCSFAVFIFSGLSLVIFNGCNGRDSDRPEIKISRLKAAIATPKSLTDCVSGPENSAESKNQRADCIWNTLTQHESPAWAEWTSKPNKGAGLLTCPDASSQHSGKTGDSAHKAFLKSLYARNEGSETEHFDKSKPFLHDTWAELASVMYSDDAIEYICEQIAPSTASTLLMDRMQENATLVMRQAASTHKGTPIIVKTLWAQVPNPLVNASIAVWDPNWPENSWRTFSKWRELKLDSDVSSPCNYTADKSIISGSCFYIVPMKMEDLDPPNGADINRQILGYRAGKNGSYFLLLAVNIAAKGPTGWTWQTYNWSVEAFAKSISQVKLPPPLISSSPSPVAYWSHYLRKTNSTPGEALYSPYLELDVMQPSPDKTQCAACHAKAAFHTGKQAPDMFSCTTENRICPARTDHTDRVLNVDSLWTLGGANAGTNGVH